MKTLSPLEAMLEPIQFAEYMRQPEAAISNEPFEEWRARCRPVPTNPATMEHGDE